MATTSENSNGLLQPGRWLPEIWRGLNEMIVRLSPQQPLAVFDWDNTCAKGDIGEAVMDELDKRDPRDRWSEYSRLIKEQGKPAAYTYAACQMAGMTEVQLRQLTAEVIEECLASRRIQKRPEMQDLIGTLHRHGWQVWIVSASSQAMVEVFARSYGIAAERVIGVRLQKDSAGRLLPKLDGPLTFRAGKVQAIEKYIGLTPSFAAGDTDTDIDMLRSARHRLLIDSGNPEARQAAAEGGWWVQPAWERG
jgi:HAD superfamily phosphoserine phosphatase-like hydrolase